MSEQTKGAAYERRVARRVLILLEVRRIFDDRGSREDFIDCRLSADKIRLELNQEIMNAEVGGDLEKSLKCIRDASTAFVRSAGKDSINFSLDTQFFWTCLEAYRDTVAGEVNWLANNYGLSLDGSLRALRGAPRPGR